MPYTVGRSGECPASRPVAVLGPDGKVMGCHPSREAAERQVAALYANEQDGMNARIRRGARR